MTVRRWIDRLNRAQQVIVSIGLAAALGALGRAVELWGGGSGGGGWFGYAPSTRITFTSGSPFLLRHPALDLLWWLLVIAVWVGASVWVFTDRAVDRPPPDPPQ